MSTALDIVIDSKHTASETSPSKNVNYALLDQNAHAEFIHKIKKELIEKTYYDDLKDNLSSKSRWKTIGDVTEAFAHLFMGISAILAFAAGSFNLTLLSFISGCVATTSLVLLRFSSYCMKESTERTTQVNKILHKLGIEEIADITVDSTAETPESVVEV